MQPSHLRQPSDPSPHQDQQSFSSKPRPSSVLLQDLLREKKASQRVSRISECENAAMKERQVQSSPIGPSAVGKTQSRRISGPAVPKDMGVREMEEYISKISKQNFDLKLEIFQRRHRAEALEAKAARADELETENEEFRQINDDLLHELEKRDAAVGEAVSLICELEAKVENLEKQGQYNTRPNTPARDHAPIPEGSRPLDSPTLTPNPPSSLKSSGESFSAQEDHIVALDKDRKHEDRGHDRLLRSPSFLHDDKPSTSALRGLFQSYDSGPNAFGFGSTKTSSLSLPRVGSPLSQEDTDALDADNLSLSLRRLSLLSESSFDSLYDQNTPSNAHNASSLGDNLDIDDFTRKLSPEEGRIRHWVESREHQAGGSKRQLKSARPNAFSSIGEVIGPSEADPNDDPSSVSPTPLTARQRQQQSQRLVKTDNRTSLAGPFGPDAFPPTPGTMSTATLGGRSSNHSINAGQSLGNGSCRPTNSNVSNLPYPLSYGTHGGLRSVQDNGAQKTLQSSSGNDIDIEVPEEEQNPAYRNTYLDQGIYLDDKPRPASFLGRSIRADQVNGSRSSQRPRLSSYGTDAMVNGAGTGITPPLRTISYPSPSKSGENGAQISSQQSQQGLAGSNDRRAASTQQESKQDRAQNPASRVHSQHVQDQHSPPPQPPLKPSPNASSEELHLPRRRYQTPGLLASNVDTDGYFLTTNEGTGEGEQRIPAPLQNKRLSVGALGRSASLRIREGFARKK
ncbi:MAG: hypothetical protein Q9182_002922 [Xanthomendoza sp. 2 TL-2023]